MREFYKCTKDFMVTFQSKFTSNLEHEFPIKKGSWWYLDEGGPIYHPELDVRLCALSDRKWVEMTKERLEKYFMKVGNEEV